MLCKKCLFFSKFYLNSRICLVLVLLSASVERCFFSRMRDFLLCNLKLAILYFPQIDVFDVTFVFCGQQYCHSGIFYSSWYNFHFITCIRETTIHLERKYLFFWIIRWSRSLCMIIEVHDVLKNFWIFKRCLESWYLRPGTKICLWFICIGFAILCSLLTYFPHN